MVALVGLAIHRCDRRFLIHILPKKPSRRQLPTDRSQFRFAEGASMLVRFGYKPVDISNWITSRLNFESWSKMT